MTPPSSTVTAPRIGDGSGKIVDRQLTFNFGDSFGNSSIAVAIRDAHDVILSLKTAHVVEPTLPPLLRRKNARAAHRPEMIRAALRE
ncbi:MAG: hypothetical protein ACR2G0_12660 [Chthoniobacterales bacterium]